MRQLGGVVVLHEATQIGGILRAPKSNINTFFEHHSGGAKSRLQTRWLTRVGRKDTCPTEARGSRARGRGFDAPNMRAGARIHARGKHQANTWQGGISACRNRKQTTGLSLPLRVRRFRRRLWSPNDRQMLGREPPTVHEKH